MLLFFYCVNKFNMNLTDVTYFCASDLVHPDLQFGRKTILWTLPYLIKKQSDKLQQKLFGPTSDQY